MPGERKAKDGHFCPEQGCSSFPAQCLEARSLAALCSTAFSKGMLLLSLTLPLRLPTRSSTELIK